MNAHRTFYVDGVPFSWSRGGGRWVAVLGEGYVVHFVPPTWDVKKWIARHPAPSIEPIAVADSFESLIGMTLAHYRAICADADARIRARLEAALGTVAATAPKQGPRPRCEMCDGNGVRQPRRWVLQCRRCKGTCVEPSL